MARHLHNIVGRTQCIFIHSFVRKHIAIWIFHSFQLPSYFDIYTLVVDAVRRARAACNPVSILHIAFALCCRCWRGRRRRHHRHRHCCRHRGHCSCDTNRHVAKISTTVFIGECVRCVPVSLFSVSIFTFFPFSLCVCGFRSIFKIWIPVFISILRSSATVFSTRNCRYFCRGAAAAATLHNQPNILLLARSMQSSSRTPPIHLSQFILEIHIFYYDFLCTRSLALASYDLLVLPSHTFFSFLSLFHSPSLYIYLSLSLSLAPTFYFYPLFAAISQNTITPSVYCVCAMQLMHFAPSHNCAQFDEN